MFEEIRFIGKEEVSTRDEISHAGNEVVDFVATVLARELWEIEQKKNCIEIEGMRVLNLSNHMVSKIVRKQKIHDSYF
ncbi:hypothetical protein [Halalkalibacter urbisdiaboli]|uniref:hypothetical protein n=1 Tax=Halalkalibacter urbisdiaboli TaxID=1960589 RepID=UPI000B438EFE|nr:hypothetical protein [Halalkalibacter urbisdiaboli]